ncbi:MAG: O-antigen ligase family protein [Candidatus Peregrinibacteria bacterium]
MICLLQTLFGVFLFVFPFSLRFLVYEQNAYRFGHFSPWVSEFVYLPELLLVVTFGLWAYEKRGRFLASLRSLGMTKGALFITLITIFLVNAFLITVWQGDWVLGLFFVWRVLEIVMLALLITHAVMKPQAMVKILLGGAVFQIALMLMQWKLNHSVGLEWFGEPMIGPDVLNVAKIDLPNGLKQIRPYGTFLHPNILASYLLVILFCALDYLKATQKIPWLIILGFGIYFTQSLAGFGVAVMALGLWILFSVLRHPVLRRGLAGVGLVMLILVNVWFFLNSDRVTLNLTSFQQRLEQNVISADMTRAHPLGVGVRNFTLEMEQFSDRKLQPWEFQPVHNTYFLILSEVGVQGLLLLTLLIGATFYFWRHGKAIPLISLLLLAPFDHFLWDSFAGMMLVGLAVGFFALHNRTSDIT